VTFASGSSGGTGCTVTSVNGYAGGVNFSCDNGPSGLNCAPSPGSASLTPGGSTSVKFTFTADPALPPGKHQIDAVVKSADGTIVRRVTISVTTT